HRSLGRNAVKIVSMPAAANFSRGRRSSWAIDPRTGPKVDERWASVAATELWYVTCTHSSVRRSPMKSLVAAFVTCVALVGTSSAHAAVWDLSWSSQWDGLIVTTSPPGLAFGTGVASGQSTATITPTSAGITINFDTAVGVAQ